MSESSPQSPCISVCVLNTEDVCLGCYRSASEVAGWFMASDQDKRDILQRAQQRMKSMTTIQLN